MKYQSFNESKVPLSFDSATLMCLVCSACSVSSPVRPVCSISSPVRPVCSTSRGRWAWWGSTTTILASPFTECHQCIRISFEEVFGKLTNGDCIRNFVRIIDFVPRFIVQLPCSYNVLHLVVVVDVRPTAIISATSLNSDVQMLNECAFALEDVLHSSRDVAALSLFGLLAARGVVMFVRKYSRAAGRSHNIQPITHPRSRLCI